MNEPAKRAAVKRDVTSLRSTIEWLRAEGDLVETDKEVNPDLEITGLQKHFDGSIPILFSNVRGKLHARFDTPAGRKSAAAAIDAGIGAWTREREAAAAAALLQGAGVHAHPVNTMADLFTDPQLIARRHWSRQRHPVIGEHAYCGPAFELSETPGEVTSAAPLLGADNAKVFREILGLSDSDYASMREAGAFA